MDIAAKRSARQHNSFVMRFGCCLVCVSLLLSLVCQPKAKAFSLTTAAVGSVALIFLASAGYRWIVDGMDQTGLADSMAQQLQDFLDETHVGETVLSYFADVASITASGDLGMFRLPRLLTERFTEFAEWFYGKFGFVDNSSSVVSTLPPKIILDDGSYYVSSVWDTQNQSVPSSLGTLCHLGDEYMFSSSFRLLCTDDFYLKYLGPSFSVFSKQYDGLDYAFIFYYNNMYIIGYHVLSGYKSTGVNITDTLNFTASSSLTAEKPQDLHYPEVAEDSQVYEITVEGVTATDIEGIIQGAVDQILAGTAEIAGTVTEAQDVPGTDEPPELDGLGLPALGAALITRFPFSIPWDIARGVKLLAAPMETPYFEVDFFAPISDLVGGWKGSTKIVLDFSEFEMIGRLSRLTSTIGFCLMLAAGTKRLIWVA